MSSPANHWVHDLSPFVVEFSEGFGLRYYGLAYVLGAVAGWLLLELYTRRGRSPLTSAQNADLVLALIVGVLVGGRLGYFLLYHPTALWREPLALLRVWEGGMASHGGFLGVVAAVAWFGWRQRVSWLRLGDLATTVAPPGILLGRVANFINGELWGRVSDVRWAVIFPQSAPGEPVESIPPRHPSQLYAAGLEGLGVLLWMQWRFWRGTAARERPGHLAGEFLIVYAVARIVGETFREPDATPLLGLTRGTFYSLWAAAAGAGLIWWSRKKAPVPERPTLEAKPKRPRGR